LLLSPSAWTVGLLAVQTAVFAIGAWRGVQHTPYAWMFKTFLRPRLAAPRELEDAAAPRFAQTVGLLFAVLALAGYGLGADLVGAVATGFALAAAFLNAAFGFCLGCEIYLLLNRATSRRVRPPRETHDNPSAGPIPVARKVTRT